MENNRTIILNFLYWLIFRPSHKGIIKAKHVNQYNPKHIINWEGAHIVYKSNNWHSRLMVETSCIFARDSFNRMKSTLGVDSFSANLVLNSSPNIQIDPPWFILFIIFLVCSLSGRPSAAMGNNVILYNLLHCNQCRFFFQY